MGFAGSTGGKRGGLVLYCAGAEVAFLLPLTSRSGSCDTLSARLFYPIHIEGRKMNKTFEAIRGSWITGDRETAEANRNILHKCLDRIPNDICETFLHVLEWETIPNDIIVDGTAKDAEQHIDEVSFLERQIKVLIDAIRSTKTADSIPQLRTVARETIERMTDWKYEEEQKRLGLDLAGRAGSTRVP
jgi:hypothetical protein